MEYMNQSLGLKALPQLSFLYVNEIKSGDMESKYHLMLADSDGANEQSILLKLRADYLSCLGLRMENKLHMYHLKLALAKVYIQNIASGKRGNQFSLKILNKLALHHGLLMESTFL